MTFIVCRVRKRRMNTVEKIITEAIKAYDDKDPTALGWLKQKLEQAIMEVKPDLEEMHRKGIHLSRGIELWEKNLSKLFEE